MYWIVEIVFDSEIEEGIERIFALDIGDFGDGLALVRLESRISHFENLDPMPFASEQMRLHQVFAETLAECRISVDTLLLFDGLIEDVIPRLHISKSERIAQVELSHKRLAQNLWQAATADQRLQRSSVCRERSGFLGEVAIASQVTGRPLSVSSMSRSSYSLSET